MRLAAAAGLTVPPVRLIHLGARAVMLIRRFDRYWAKPGEDVPLPEDLLSTARAAGLAEKRLGFVSGLTLVACDEMESPDESYADFAPGKLGHRAAPAPGRGAGREDRARISAHR